MPATQININVAILRESNLINLIMAVHMAKYIISDIIQFILTKAQYKNNTIPITIPTISIKRILNFLRFRDRRNMPTFV